MPRKNWRLVQETLVRDARAAAQAAAGAEIGTVFPPDWGTLQGPSEVVMTPNGPVKMVNRHRLHPSAYKHRVIQMRKRMRKHGAPFYDSHKRGMRRITVSPVTGRPIVPDIDTYLTLESVSAMGLGDLFNDVMKAVVPGWKHRPDWLKQIKIQLPWATTGEAIQAGVKKLQQEFPNQAEAINRAMMQAAQQGMIYGKQYALERAKQTATDVATNPMTWAVVAGVVVLAFAAGGRRARRY